MAELDHATSREAIMSAQLSLFWSSMRGKFDRDRVQPPRTPSTLSLEHDDLRALTAPPKVIPAAESYLKGALTEQDEAEPVWSVAGRSSHTPTREGSDPYPGVGECVVDGEAEGDVPGRYVVRGLQAHECPVVGTYVHPTIMPGFCYHVRPADSSKMLFKGQALRLLSVGRGYGKRLTFASDTHNVNDNYFWSDTNPAGYGFSLMLVREGDKFTLKDANNVPVATAQVTLILKPQLEVSHQVLSCGSIKKMARVSFLCRLTYLEEGWQEQVVEVRGLAHALRTKGASSPAVVTKIAEVSVGGERGYTLVAGAHVTRVTRVSGCAINDIPTKYSIKGLQPHEMPVIGTYVDARIMPGFKYMVRPADSRRSLFKGAALLLVSVGRGYGKRLTFASRSLNNNENYFWSDSHPEGYAFSIKAVSPGDQFSIITSTGENLGQAQVLRADLPQQEESSSVSPEGHVTKMVRVTVLCSVTFQNEETDSLTVTGTAVVTRRGRVATVQRIEDVAVDSQLNMLFRRTSRVLQFVRE